MAAQAADIAQHVGAEDAVAAYLRRFPGADVAHVGVARAPGRVNLIGEHTDYNGGFVLPMALDRATFVAFAPRTDQTVRLWSERMQAYDEFRLSTLTRARGDRWRNYPRGVAALLQSHGISLRGMSAAVVSDVPLAAGVSSSAAFEISVALALLRASDASLGKRDIALLCQRAENEFVGMRCGILDQFASVLGREDAAVLIDCRSLETTHVPIHEAQLAIVVCDTTKPRELAGTEYNKRREQCERAAEALGVSSLRDIGEDRLPEAERVLDEQTFRRCRHVVMENARVLQAVEALRAGDAERLGALVSASHASLRDDYEVSCDELNVMCEIAESVPGCHGARLVGAGFGGCVVAIVSPEVAATFARNVGPRYEAATGVRPRIFTAHSAPGAGYVLPQNHLR